MTCSLCEPNHTLGYSAICYCSCHRSPIPPHISIIKTDQKTRPATHTHCFCKSKDIDGILHEVCCMCGQRKIKVTK